MSDLVQRLRDRIEQLEGQLCVDRSTVGRMREAFGLEPIHAQILGMLFSREFVTRDGLYTVLYEGRPECEWPDEKMLDVQMCKLRSALKRAGLEIVIETKWGEGWHIGRADKAKIGDKLDKNMHTRMHQGLQQREAVRIRWQNTPADERSAFARRIAQARWARAALA
jgi:hypothetical protein